MSSPLAFAQTTDQAPPSSVPNQEFQLTVKSNLVVVRVVVRDAEGKPVVGLRKEDFKLFDSGKEQTIAQFQEEVAAPEASMPTVPIMPTQSVAAPSQARVAPQHLLMLYFDDLDMSESDVIDARDAADHYLATTLQPSERVAIFTSATILTDFTADTKQIHDALFRIHPHPHIARHTDCPDISDYQALEISQRDNPNTSDAWRVALDEAVNRCNMPKVSDEPIPSSDPPAPSGASPVTVTFIRNLARSIVAQSQIQSRMSLQGLEQAVNGVSRVAGQKSIILISPGFMSQSEQYQLDRIIDRALRSQVVISSLDPRGLALLMREADVTNGYTPSAASGAVGPQHAIDTNREMVATDVLAEVAEGTGGEYFHNNNDLKAGFAALAGLQGSYILAFAPIEVKQDGKFHALKVTLSEKHKRISLRARRGYFAPKKGEIAEAEPQPQLETRTSGSAPSDADTLERARIHDAVLSKTDVQNLPVELRTEVSKASGNDELEVLAHLDTNLLHLHKEGERNQNTVTFVSVIFDQSGKYLTGQQQQARVDVPDDALPNFLTAGIDIKITFELKSGKYTIREVVTGSEDHQITAFSRSFEIP